MVKARMKMFWDHLTLAGKIATAIIPIFTILVAAIALPLQVKTNTHRLDKAEQKLDAQDVTNLNNLLWQRHHEKDDSLVICHLKAIETKKTSEGCF